MTTYPLGSPNPLWVAALGTLLLLTFSTTVLGTEAPTVVWCDWNTLDWLASKTAVLAWNASSGRQMGNGGLRFLAVLAQPELMQGINDWGLWVTEDLAKKSEALCDTYILGGSVGGFFDAGELEDLTTIVNTDTRFQWEQVSFPTRRFVAEYDEKVIAVPLTIEFPIMFYRRDLVRLLPNTWEEAINVAQQLNGTDMNGDGVPDWGFCVDPTSDFPRQALGIVASIMKFAVGNRQGYMYDLSDNDVDPMRPLFATKGYAYALNITRRMLQLSAPGLWQTDRWVNVTPNWESGACALYLTWAGEGGAARRQENNKLTGRMGTTRMPGSTLVYNRDEDILQQCDLNLCPYLELGGVNRPSLQAGGNRFVVRAHPRNLNATVDMILAYISAVDPRLKDSVPIRDDQLNNVSYYVSGGWDTDDAALYLAALKDTAVSLHMLLFVPIPTFEENWRLFALAVQEAARIAPYENSTRSDLEIAALLQERVRASDAAAGFSQSDIENRYRQYYSLPPLSAKSNSGEVRLAWILTPVALLFVILLTVTFVSIAHSVRRQRLAREGNSAAEASPKRDGHRSATAVNLDLESDDDLPSAVDSALPSDTSASVLGTVGVGVEGPPTTHHPAFVVT